MQLPLRKLFFYIFLSFYPLFFLSIIFQNQSILKNGTVVQLVLSPVDPLDPFRGSYLALNYDFPEFLNTQYFKKGQTVFLPLIKESSATHRIGQPVRNTQKQELYLKSEIRWVNTDLIGVEIPSNLQRYYLNQDLMPKAEALIQKRFMNQDSTVSVKVQLRVKGSEAVIEDLLIDDKSLLSHLD